MVCLVAWIRPQPAPRMWLLETRMCWDWWEMKAVPRFGASVFARRMCPGWDIDHVLPLERISNLKKTVPLEVLIPLWQPDT